MAEERTPTTEDVQEAYVASRATGDNGALPCSRAGEAAARAEFVRWLAERDAAASGRSRAGVMSVADRLDQIETRARTYSGLGYEHEGDCSGSLCPTCGHCLHSIEDCQCSACGCADFVEDDETLMKRETLRAVAALRALLAVHEPIATAGVPTWRCKTCDGEWPCAEFTRTNDTVATALQGAPTPVGATQD